MSNDVYASFWEHLEAFRLILIRCLLIIAVTTGFSFFFYGEIFSYLQGPLQSLVQVDRQSDEISHFKLYKERFQNMGEQELSYGLESALRSQKIALSPNAKDLGSGNYLLPKGEFIDVEYPVLQQDLLILSPLDGMTTALKISLFTGILLSSPLTLFLLLHFFSPALRLKERSLIIPFMFLSLIALFGGLYCGLNITIPLANQFFYSFNSQIGLNFWTLEKYLSYSLFLLFSHGIAFELCLILLFAVHLGIIKADQMRRQRRIVCLSAFIIGAVLTPPDVLTQVVMASFLITFYEIAILYASLRTVFKLARTSRNVSS